MKRLVASLGKGLARVRWPEVVMAVCTVGIVWYAKVQSGIAGQQAQIMDQQTHILDTTLVMDQRAWVGPVDMSASEIKEGSRLTVSIPLANSGRTPALKVRVQLGSWVDLSGKPFKPDYRPSTGGLQSVAVIQPGSRQYLNGVCDESFTREKVNGIADKDLLLVVYGRITYEDVFTRTHETTFAYRWMPSPLCVWRVLDTDNTAD